MSVRTDVNNNHHIRNGILIGSQMLPDESVLVVHCLLGKLSIIALTFDAAITQRYQRVAELTVASAATVAAESMYSNIAFFKTNSTKRGSAWGRIIIQICISLSIY